MARRPTPLITEDGEARHKRKGRVHYVPIASAEGKAVKKRSMESVTPCERCTYHKETQLGWCGTPTPSCFKDGTTLRPFEGETKSQCQDFVTRATNTFSFWEMRR